MHKASARLGGFFNDLHLSMFSAIDIEIKPSSTVTLAVTVKTIILAWDERAFEVKSLHSWALNVAVKTVVSCK